MDETEAGTEQVAVSAVPPAVRNMVRYAVLSEPEEIQAAFDLAWCQVLPLFTKAPAPGSVEHSVLRYAVMNLVYDTRHTIRRQILFNFEPPTEPTGTPPVVQHPEPQQPEPRGRRRRPVDREPVNAFNSQTVAAVHTQTYGHLYRLPMAGKTLGSMTWADLMEWGETCDREAAGYTRQAAICRALLPLVRQDGGTVERDVRGPALRQVLEGAGVRTDPEPATV